MRQSEPGDAPVAYRFDHEVFQNILAIDPPRIINAIGEMEESGSKVRIARYNKVVKLTLMSGEEVQISPTTEESIINRRNSTNLFSSEIINE